MARSTSKLWTRRSSTYSAKPWWRRTRTLVVAVLVCMTVLCARRLLRSSDGAGDGEETPSDLQGERTSSLEPGGAAVEKAPPAVVRGSAGAGPVVECRAWNETDLPRKRDTNDRIYDKALPPKVPTPGVRWRFTASEDMQGGWLGVHNFDPAYVHGSAEADRRVERLGYCRVHMPSIPRAGSTWFRTMFEVATGRPTTAMWPEGGEHNAQRRYYVSHDPCGASPDQMEGSRKARRPHVCRNVTLPGDSDPIVFKSHTPFFPSYDRQSLDPEDTCAVVLIVRNPVDAHDAWRRYAQQAAKHLRDYLPVWAGHLSHWIAETPDIPLIVFRYEDLLWRADKVLEMVLTALGPGWNWSPESIARALQYYGPREPFAKKCGKSLPTYTLAELEMVRTHYRGLLAHFGYAFERVA